MRRSFRDMGQAACVGFIATLYVNGYLKGKIFYGFFFPEKMIVYLFIFFVGVYNPTEKIEQDWLQAVHGIPSSVNWDILKLGTWESGNNTWKEYMRTWILNNNPSDANNWKFIINNVRWFFLPVKN